MLKIKEMKPKIGFIGESRQDILDDLIFAAKNQFDYYELSAHYEGFSLKDGIIQQAKKISRNNNIFLNLHIPYFLPINSLIPGVSIAAFKFIKEEVILANKLGAKRITIHSGDKDLPDNKTVVEKNLKILIKNLRKTVNFAKKYEIKIGLENSVTSGRICRTAEELLNVTNSIKGLGVVFDVGHMNAIGLDPIEYFKKVKNRIINIHISDNDGKTDQHVLIGKGNIDFKALLRECKSAGYYGPFILEIFPPKDILKAKEIFLNLWNQI